MKHSLKFIFTKGDENISPADTTDLRRKKSAVISPALSGRNYFQMKKIFYLFCFLFFSANVCGVTNEGRDISVKSELDKGTCFTIILPAKQKVKSI